MKCTFCHSQLEWLNKLFCSKCSVYYDTEKNVILFNTPTIINGKKYILLIDYKEGKTKLYSHFMVYHLEHPYQVKPILVVDAALLVHPKNISEKIATLLIWS